MGRCAEETTAHWRSWGGGESEWRGILLLRGSAVVKDGQHWVTKITDVESRVKETYNNEGEPGVVVVMRLKRDIMETNSRENRLAS